MEDKGNNPDADAPGDGGGFVPRVTVDGVSAWVVSAFFSSLERFSCVNISTSFDDDDSDDDDDVTPDVRYNRPPDAVKELLGAKKVIT